MGANGWKTFRRHFRRNLLPIVCCSFVFFWCGLAVMMIMIYSNLIYEIPGTNLVLPEAGYKQKLHDTAYNPPPRRFRFFSKSRPQDDVPFVTRPPPVEKPCEKIYCAYGGECVEEGNKAVCKCNEKCPPVFAPVCGTDDVTYNSECNLRKASCDTQKRIKVKLAGNCDKKDPCENKVCPFGGRCVASIDGTSARCQCIDKCYDFGDTVDSGPVCGSDGKDYKSSCELNKASCLQFKDIKIKYLGKCDPCKDYKCGPTEVCQIRGKRQPFCTCQGICQSEYAPVCGSDHRTYSNECIMKREACKARKDLFVMSTGECQPEPTSSSTTSTTPSTTSTSTSTTSPSTGTEQIKDEELENFDFPESGEWQKSAEWETNEEKTDSTSADKNRDKDNESTRVDGKSGKEERGEMMATHAEEQPRVKGRKYGLGKKSKASKNKKQHTLNRGKKMGREENPKVPAPRTRDYEIRTPSAPRIRDGEIRTPPAPRITDYEIRTPPAPRTRDYEIRTPPAPRIRDYEIRTPPAPRIRDYEIRTPPAPRIRDYEIRTPPAPRTRDYEFRTPPAPRVRDGEIRTPPAPRIRDYELRTPMTPRISDSELRTPLMLLMRDSEFRRPLRLKMKDSDNAAKTNQLPGEKKSRRKYVDESQGRGEEIQQTGKTLPGAEKDGSEAVKQERVLTGAHPCDSVSCGTWEECRIDRQGRAKCACPPPCEPILRQVCGSDEKTYDNECELKQAACRLKKQITIKFMGACGKDGPCANHKCEYGAMCVVRSDEPACECPKCWDDRNSVCGTDGISYNNECKLKAENCLRRTNVQVKHQGLCNGCENVRCAYYSICQSDENGDAQCICPESCIQVDSKVCGNDGKTYQNECELKIESCKRKEFLMTASYGPCDQCADVKCPFHAQCENGICLCTQRCPDNYNPVCGSDGQTYTSECTLKRTACLKKLDIQVTHQGDCEDFSGGDDLEDSSGRPEKVCDKTTCKFGGICQSDADAEGRVVCVCNYNCEEEGELSPVCGNDGRIYLSLCNMREASCLKQTDIAALPLATCQGIDKPCDGKAPLVNPRSGLEYDCSTGRDTCPGSSYCHKGLNYAKCCEEKQGIKRCDDSLYGCCPDRETPAPGPNDAGCPSICNCNPIGAYGSRCDPTTQQCICKPGVRGQKCDRCEPGYWGLPFIKEGNSGCMRCGCNEFGSVRDDCEQMTGRCVCKPGIKGMKCNLCADGSKLGPGGCGPEESNSCEGLKCQYGAKCVFVNGQAKCECPSCPDNEYPLIKVCGTDRMSYGSQCQLQSYACRLHKEISVEHEGPCTSNSFPDTTPRPLQRSHKTTRHIGSRKTTRHLTMPTGETPILSKYGKIEDVCKMSNDCLAVNSYCLYGICRCKNGLMPTKDRRICYDVPLIVPQFSGASFIELRKIPNANMELFIEMEFRTLNNHGILLYNGNSKDGSGDFLSLAVKDGYVEFRFDLGSGVAVVKSRDRISLQEFHQVTARRSKQTGTLKIDDEEIVLSTSSGDLLSLNLNEPLYLGYVPSMSKGIIEDIGVDVGLVGCIQSLKVYNTEFMKEYSLVYPESLDIKGARGLAECGNNPCNSLPCLNGGLCMTVDNTKFRCICEAGYEGETCSNLIDLCKSDPCMEGSTCINIGDGTYECKCKFGWSGKHCQKEEPNYQADNFVPEFAGDSFIEYKYNDNAYTKIAFQVWFLTYEDNGVLLYNGQNKDGKGDYLSLNLVNGFLQFKFDLGSGSANIVSNQKVRKNVWHKVQVERNKQTGFMNLDDNERIYGRSKGLLQSLNLDQQLYIGGFKDRYTITVESGVTTGLRGAIQRLYINGRHIENLPKVASDMQHISMYLGMPCDNNPCMNGGTCMPVLNKVKCKCPMTYGGNYCETAISEEISKGVKPIHFDGNTFLNYFNRVNRKEVGQKSNHFKIKFKTKAKNGLLLIQHKSSHISGDFISVAIVRGQVEFSYNLGNQEKFFTVRSPAIVSDGKWHTVEVKRQKRKGSIVVDDGETYAAVSGQGATQLDTDGHLWIGGKKNLLTGLPRKYYEPFIGCIHTVEIDNEELNMVRDKKNEVAIVFCDKK